MMLKFGTIILKIDLIEIIHKKYGMGVADIHGNGILQWACANAKVEGVHLFCKGDLMPGCSKPSHGNGYLLVPFHITLEYTAQCAKRNRLGFAFFH